MNPFGFLAPLVPLAVMAGLLLSLRLKAVRQALLWLVSLPPAAALVLIGLVAVPLWRPLQALTGLVLRVLPLDRGIAQALALPSRFSGDPLMRADRRAVAERLWPPLRFPALYRSVPDDVVRPPWEDGRLIGNVPVAHLADRHLTEPAFRSAVRAGLVAGLLVLLLLVVLLALSTLFAVAALIPALAAGDRPIVERWDGDDVVRAPVWPIIAAQLGHALASLAATLARLLVYLPAALLIAGGTAVVIMLLLLTAFLREQGAPYELATKDADVRWPFRIEARGIVGEAYRRQVLHATERLRGSARFLIGRATGTLRARGDVAGPTIDQAVMLDEESLFQHLLVFGGTGEGKTTALLRPLARAVLADRRFGAFVIDAKGVLWRDVQGIAEQLGRADDVVVIGSGAGTFGVNLTAGLTPTQTTAVLRSVLTQIGGGRKDDFWPSMATTILRHMLTIGAGLALVPAPAPPEPVAPTRPLGKDDLEAIDPAHLASADQDGDAPASEPPPRSPVSAAWIEGVHPASLWWAYQAVLNPQQAADAVAAIRSERALLDEQHAYEVAQETPDAARADALLDGLAALTSDELESSIAYVSTAWPEMARSTRTGIIANVTNLLDGFGSAPHLRDRFIIGADEETVAADAALAGKIVVVNLSSIDDGLPARLVMVLLKTALYRAARRREIAWRAEGRAPQDAPCLVMMDEVQELATVDPTSGLSDATFWNVARSTGLAGVFATQTVSALRQAMGEEAQTNFVQQARSKVFLRTEEPETVGYACWAAGEFERNRVYDAAHRESLEARELIDGWTPLLPLDEARGVAAGPLAFFEAAAALLSPGRAQLPVAAARPAYAADERFIPDSLAKDVALQARGTATWRAEDLERAYRSTGNDRLPALTPTDLAHMGRWHAFAQIQRAGAVRQDIIRVHHDFD